MMLILEGPDGGGKSTLAAALGGEIIHHGPDLDLDSAELMAKYLHSLRSGAILDRSWLSEPIYAAEMRHTKSRLSKADLLQLDHMAWPAMVVCCVPSKETMLETWRARQSEEYVKREKVLRRIWHRYAVLHQETYLPVLYWNRDYHDVANTPLVTLLRDLI